MCNKGKWSGFPFRVSSLKSRVLVRDHESGGLGCWALNVPVVAAVSVSEQVVASATSDFVVDALASMDPAKAPALH
eukprot:145131-Amorphochlora_amoeboformis.AAC.1